MHLLRTTIRRTAPLLIALAILPGFATAQEGDAAGESEDGEFSEGFGGEFGSGFGESEGNTGDASAGSSGDESGGAGGGESAGGTDGGFGSGFGSSGPSLDWGGMLRFDTRAVVDYDDPEESPISAQPDLHLDLLYSNRNSELTANLEFRPEYLADAEDATEYAREMIDEAYLTLFYDRFTVEAGYLKEVWGTGDQVHVVDLLNSNDLRDFVNPDYAERRLARPMFKLSVPVRMQGRLEAVYIPTFEPDLIPREGIWAPAQAAELTQLVSGVRAEALAGPPPPATSGYTDITAAEAATLQNTLVEPETSTLEWGQYAARYRDTLGSVDLGLIYYHGFLKQPSAEFVTDNISDPPTELTLQERFDLGDQIILDYDRVNVFGIEYAAVVAGFNTRAEAAYYLTEDIDGDDPAVTNNSVQYLAGFDRDLPLSDLNLNMQGVGTYYLATEEIEDNVEKRREQDFQYDEEGEYTSHTVSLALTDSYANENIKPEIALSYGIEDEDWYVNPSIEFSLLDDVKLFTEVALFYGDEGRFGQYEENHFAQIRLEYSF